MIRIIRKYVFFTSFIIFISCLLTLAIIVRNKLNISLINFSMSIIAPFFMLFYTNELHYGKLKLFNHKYFIAFPVKREELIFQELLFMLKMKKFILFLIGIFIFLVFSIEVYCFNIFIIISTILTSIFIIIFSVLLRNISNYEKGVEKISLMMYFNNYLIFVPILLRSYVNKTIGPDCISKYNPFSGLFLTLFMYEWKEKIVASFILIFSLWITFLLYNKCQKEWRI